MAAPAKGCAILRGEKAKPQGNAEFDALHDALVGPCGGLQPVGLGCVFVRLGFSTNLVERKGRVTGRVTEEPRIETAREKQKLRLERHNLV